MAKTIKLSRNGQTKTVPTAQWKSMKDAGATYGWVPTSELSKEVTDKDSEIESTRIKELEAELADAKKTIAEKDERISTLETRFNEHLQHDALLDGNIGDVEKGIETIDNVEALQSLLRLETDGENRKGAKEAIEGKIKDLTPPKPEPVKEGADLTGNATNTES